MSQLFSWHSFPLCLAPFCQSMLMLLRKRCNFFVKVLLFIFRKPCRNTYDIFFLYSVTEDQDAMMFPFIGSAVLFGLYLLFKTFSKEYINMLLTAYFLLIGFISLTKSFGVVIGRGFGLSSAKFTLGSFTIPRIPYVFESMLSILLFIHL